MQEVDQSCIELVNAGVELAWEARMVQTGDLPNRARGIGTQKSIVAIKMLNRGVAQPDGGPKCRGNWYTNW
jgi:hypothetical protein